MIVICSDLYIVTSKRVHEGSLRVFIAGRGVLYI